MIHLGDFKTLVTHVVNAMGHPYVSPDAISLVIRTCVYESDLFHLRQVGTGPARGFAQIELGEMGATDILRRYLARKDKAELREKVHSLIGFDPVALSEDNYMLDMQLQGNIILGIVCCRLKYGMIPKPLPSKDDRGAQGRYYKKYYNSKKGKGSAEDFARITAARGA
jgi:hypothetical protein